MSRKIITERDLIINLCNSFRAVGRTLVFTNGVFDIIHPGHVEYLQKAKHLGNILIIGVNNDASIQQYKDRRRPINPLPDRMEVLAALSMVDYVTPFAEETAVELIKALKPDMYVKCGDFKEEELPEAAVVKKYNGRIRIIPYREGYSTTNIIQTIVKRFSRTAIPLPEGAPVRAGV